MFRNIFIALPLFVSGCNQHEKPCKGSAQIQSTTVLMASIIIPSEPTDSFQREFGSMAACQMARSQLRDEMDRVIERAKAAVFNSRPSQQGWTDFRSRYHPFIRSDSHQEYPDLVVSCAEKAVSSTKPDQPVDLSELRSSEVPAAIETVGSAAPQNELPSVIRPPVFSRPPIVTAPVPAPGFH